MAGSHGGGNRPRTPRRSSGAARQAGRRTKRRLVPVVADSAGGGAKTLLGQPSGSGLNSRAKVLRELIEVRDDVLTHHPGPLVGRHRVEFVGADQPRCVADVSRVAVGAAESTSKPCSDAQICAGSGRHAARKSATSAGQPITAATEVRIGMPSRVDIILPKLGPGQVQGDGAGSHGRQGLAGLAISGCEWPSAGPAERRAAERRR